MNRRLSLLVIAVLLGTALLPNQAIAKDKNKSVLPEYVLRAETVLVMIDPDAGEPLDQPAINAAARDNVEKALSEWGRYRLVLDGQHSDLVIVVRTGDGKMARPTMKGGGIDQRGGVAQSTDTTVRIGVQHGQNPTSNPTMDPMDRGPHISNEIGPSEDSFEVFMGTEHDPRDSRPVFRYIKKDCLKPSPNVPAVEEFRKAVAEAEKPKTPKTP